MSQCMIKINPWYNFLIVCVLYRQILPVCLYDYVYKETSKLKLTNKPGTVTTVYE